MYRDKDEATAITYWDLLRRGETEALTWLYNAYFSVLYNYGRKFGTEGQTLEDHIHDLYVDLWRYRASLSSTTSVKFYLYRSLRRRLVQAPRPKAAWEAEAVEPSLEDSIIEQEHRAHQSSQLESLLRQLPARQYEAVVLRFYDNLEYNEIADMLEINEQSARNLVQRGLIHMKFIAHAMTSLIPLALLSAVVHAA